MNLKIVFSCFLFFICPLSLANCWQMAAQQYGVSAQLLYAIAQQESGLNPMAVNVNKNGSVDRGLMQINSIHLPLLARYGIGAQQLFDPCTSIYVGAWVLANNTARYGYTWNAVGAYNAGTMKKRNDYAWKIYRKLYSPPKQNQVHSPSP